MKRTYFWECNGVRLRLAKEDDYLLKYQEYCNTEARRNIQYRVELPKTLEEYKADFASVGSDDVTFFCIENMEGEFVGWINLAIVDRRTGVFNINYGIFPNHLRKGYAFNAARIILQYGFQELRFAKCQVDCLDSNTPSINLLKNLGFIEEGRRRRTVFTNGKFYDVVILGMIKEEFKEDINE